MATEAHCAFCFESLIASLDRRAPLHLSSVEDLWTRYTSSTESRSRSEAATQGPDKASALTSFLSSTRASSSSTPSATSSTPSINTTVSSAASGSLKQSSNTLNAESAQLQYPLFVTWDTIARSGHKNLRGCIGTFEPHALADGLQSYALTSAFEDTRFKPISRREAPTLECSVTLLTDFEPVSDPLDWQIGEHGLRISFTSQGRRYSATYLPDVAREQGWTKEETLVSLMHKAGWSGHASAWKQVPDLRVTRYQGKKCSLSYHAWRQWRDWVSNDE